MSNFADMKKKQALLVQRADEKGYTFSEIELSVMKHIGKAESEKELSPDAEYIFYKMYDSMKTRIAKT